MIGVQPRLVALDTRIGSDDVAQVALEQLAFDLDTDDDDYSELQVTPNESPCEGHSLPLVKALPKPVVNGSVTRRGLLGRGHALQRSPLQEPQQHQQPQKQQMLIKQQQQQQQHASWSSAALAAMTWHEAPRFDGAAAVQLQLARLREHMLRLEANCASLEQVSGGCAPVPAEISCISAEHARLMGELKPQLHPQLGVGGCFDASFDAADEEFVDGGDADESFGLLCNYVASLVNSAKSAAPPALPAPSSCGPALHSTDSVASLARGCGASVASFASSDLLDVGCHWSYQQQIPAGCPWPCSARGLHRTVPSSSSDWACISAHSLAGAF